MVTTAWSGAHDADLVAVLIDATRGPRRRGGGDPRQARRDQAAEDPACSTRSTSPKNRACWRWRKTPMTRTKFAATFMVSALTGDGVADLRDWLAAQVPEGPWHYPADEMSDAPLRQLAAEITREKLYLKAAPGIALPVDGRDRDLDGAARTARCASSRRSMWSAKASARSCWARAADRSRRSAPRRGKEIADIARKAGAPVPVREGARSVGATIRSATGRWGWNFRRSRRCATWP